MSTPGPGKDPVTLLEEAGFSLDALSEEQRDVITNLTEEEVLLLLSLKARFDVTEPEVQAHTGIYAGGSMF
jgi:hypothetical protein